MGDVVALVPLDEQIAVRALARSPRRLPSLNPSAELRALVRAERALVRKGLVSVTYEAAGERRRVALTPAGHELARELGETGS